MSDDQHIRSDHYLLLRQGEVGRGSFALQVHDHLVSVCADCGAAWRLLGERQGELQDLLLATGRSVADRSPSIDPASHQSVHSWEARRLEQQVERIRRQRSAACKSGWELLQLSPGARLDRVRRARTRFRSRAEAEYLLDKVRERTREDPLDAENLCEAVIEIVRRIPDAAGEPWCAELHARATAWRANALRVAGDLPAAARIFARLRRDLVTAPLPHAGVLGEVASLEASLCIDQRRFGETHRLLDLAAAVAAATHDPHLEVRVLVQKGNLSAVQGETGRSLWAFERAAAVLPEVEVEPVCELAVVNGRIGSLCDLGLHEEAEHVLNRHLDLYERWDGLYAGAVLRYHRGRIAFGLERHEEAAQHLLDARRAFLAQGRSYDALLVTLDLALVFADGGRLDKLRSLARQLVPLFHSRRVSRETLAALQLLVQAIEAESLSRQVVAELRTRLRSEALLGSGPATPP